MNFHEKIFDEKFNDYYIKFHFYNYIKNQLFMSKILKKKINIKIEE